MGFICMESLIIYIGRFANSRRYKKFGKYIITLFIED